MPTRHDMLCGILLAALLPALGGCALVTDLSGRSVAPARRARAEAIVRTVPGTMEDVRRKTMAVADAAGWELFREVPEENLVVFHQIPDTVDSTQLGIFLSDAAQGVRVEVSCLSPFCRESAARFLFDRLQ